MTQPFGRPDSPTFSIVVPVRNESESIRELVAAIQTVFRGLDHSYELIFVDDGSTDGTLDTLKDVQRAQPRTRVVSFRVNAGKSMALACGFQMASGDFVLTLDADLQDDPADLPAMYAFLKREDVDLVSGWRKKRRDSALKVISSKVFNLVVIRILFGLSFKDLNGGMKLYRRAVAKDLQLYGGMHRFIPLIATEMGYRVAEIPVTHHERKYGTSKYRPTKIFTEIPDLLTMFFLIRYTRRPLHFFARAGSLLSTAGLVVLTYLSVIWFQGEPIGHRPLLMFGLLLVLVGAQVIFTGLLADLIVNVSGRRQPFPIRYSSEWESDIDPPK
jgi:glycosyltransferase involved in cell wall biosynthesis